MRKAEAREANVLVVEIGHVGVGKVLAVHADVHEHACRASQAPGRIEDVLRHALDHANEIRQRYRRDQRIVVRHGAVREAELPRARIERYQLVIEFQISQRDELLQIGYESTFGWVAEMRDVVHVRGGWRERATQHLLEARPVDARPQPIGAHVFGGGQVVLSRVLHGKQFGKCPTEARQQPVSIVFHRPFRRVALLHEIRDDLDDDVFRQPVQVELHRMLGPVTTPVVVQVDLHRLVLADRRSRRRGPEYGDPW